MSNTLNGSVVNSGVVNGTVAAPAPLGGSVAKPAVVRGSAVNPKAIYGKSAYEIAVANGFNGTEKEWLESLKGVLTEEDLQEIARLLANEFQFASAKIGEVELISANWVGNASPYSQVVTIEGVTENSQVDLTPSVEQLAIFHQKDLAFVTENDGGIVTVYAIGDKPLADYTIQVTITEVAI